MASMEEAFSYPMRKALLIQVATLSAMTAVMPVQAEETKTITIKSFEEKKERKLNKAEAKLEKAQAKVNCIKAAKEMNALEKCN